jgi:predicted ATPase
LFRRLAIFAGGFTLTAVESICGDKKNVLDLLTSLINKSLIVVIEREPEARYRLLEPVRQFAWEALNNSGELANLRPRHAAYYLHLAEMAKPHLHRATRPEWVERLEAEHDNLRAALRWLHQSGQLTLAMRLADALIWFWYFTGVSGSGAQQCQTLLTLAEETGNSEYTLQARMAWSVGATAWIIGDFAAARTALERSQSLARTAGDPGTLAYTLTLLGLVSQGGDDDANAISLQQESITLFREVGDRWGEALALYWLGDTLRLRQEYAAAQAYYQQSQAQFRPLADPWGISLSLQGLGSVAYHQGNLAAAREWLTEGLALRRMSGDRWLMAQTLITLGTVLVAQGETAVAKVQFEEAVALYQAVGDMLGAMYGLIRLGQITQTAGEREAASSYYQAGLVLAQSTGHQKRIETCQTALTELAQAAASDNGVTPVCLWPGSGEPRGCAVGLAVCPCPGAVLLSAGWRATAQRGDRVRPVAGSIPTPTAPLPA